MSTKKYGKKYEKKDPISHILDRPDMYVGSVRPREAEEYVYSEEFISLQNMEYAPALLRIFVEPLSNAIDNVERSREAELPCTSIKVDMNLKTGYITIFNNGDFIPIEKNKEGNYLHSMLFGELLTSSNYDDEELRLVSGRNGVGVTLTNVYSTHFKVEGYDPAKKLLLVQEWRGNMRDTDGPEIKPSKGTKIEKPTKGFTRVTYKADFTRFGIKKYDQQIFNLFSKYVYDAAMLARVKVTLNSEIINLKGGLADYALLYADPEEKTDRLKFEYENSEVVITSSDSFEVVSFVNGVYTSKGGAHVRCWTEAILRPIVKFYNDKSKNATITIKDVRQFFKLFVSVRVPNPEFEGQEKHTLIEPKGIPTDFPAAKVNILKRWDSTKRIEEIIRRKEFSALDKTTAKTKRSKIPGLDNANKAGTKFSGECVLILCEGNSAKTYAVTGIEVGFDGKKGRDYWGVMPLRGKLLNVREKNPGLIAKNQVITNIIQAFGLKYNLDYSQDQNFRTLKYGRAMLLADSDVDGIHISGLIINVFQYLFPSLLERDPTFLASMQTPIVRVFFKSSQLVFYDEATFKRYAQAQNKKLKVKYYKGLGSSSNKEIKETFGEKVLEYKEDKNTGQALNKVFGKDTAIRKTWLTNYNPDKVGSCVGNDPGVDPISISKYLNTELIKYSLDDCARSIPNLFDGLKQSQRKILYTCFQRKLNFNGKVLKVAQLSGSVAELTSYHHGEQNLYTTITKMAQAFVGSNNIPLLYRDGQMGSRLEMGKDAASARYIFTKLDALTRLLFRPEDDVLLKNMEEDGEKIEPECYVPILPMILVNGSAGIGTGWSCNVPCFNPLDLIECIKIWLEKEGQDVVDFSDPKIKISLFPELTPWYREFTGLIEEEGDHKFTSYGIISDASTGRISKKIVTELPVGMSTEKFKEHLEELEDKKGIKKFNNHSRPNKPYFEIIEKDDGIECTLHTLKLQTSLRTSNIVLFVGEGKLKKFESVDEVIDQFCDVRYKLYADRKRYILTDLKECLKWTNNKRKFLEEVMEDELILRRRKEEDIVSEMVERGYDKKLKKRKLELERANEESTEEEWGKDKGYDYLLTLPVRSFTKAILAKLDKEIAELKAKIKALDGTTEKSLWLRDLAEFETAYVKWLKVIKAEDESAKVKKNRVKKK